MLTNAVGVTIVLYWLNVGFQLIALIPCIHPLVLHHLLWKKYQHPDYTETPWLSHLFALT